MKLSKLKEIEKMEMIDGNHKNGILPYCLTHFLDRNEIEFAIEQLNAGESKPWQLRRRFDGKVALYVTQPENELGE